jgi:hypothetical protein
MPEVERRRKWGGSNTFEVSVREEEKKVLEIDGSG